jgi:hypothetical protein
MLFRCVTRPASSHQLQHARQIPRRVLISRRGADDDARQPARARAARRVDDDDAAVPVMIDRRGVPRPSVRPSVSHRARSMVLHCDGRLVGHLAVVGLMAADLRSIDSASSSAAAPRLYW